MSMQLLNSSEIHTPVPGPNSPDTETPPDDIVQEEHATSSSIKAGLKDIFLHPVVASFITGIALVFCTFWITALRNIIPGYDRPFIILYLIPVAIGAAFLGMRGGVISSCIALVLTRIFIFNDHKHGGALISGPSLGEDLEFFTLTMGMLAIGGVTGRLRSTLGLLRTFNDRLEKTNTSLEAANQRLVESERQRQAFSGEVLLAVTGGKLRLVEESDILSSELTQHLPFLTQTLLNPLDASNLRQALHELANDIPMDETRTIDLLTCSTEAATNAIKHGNGGEARVWMVNDKVWVLVEDHGAGITPTNLARATLEKGFSSRISLGMGFHLMLEASDSLSLSTSPSGTSVLIQVSNCRRLSETDALLAKYLDGGC